MGYLIYTKIDIIPSSKKLEQALKLLPRDMQQRCLQYHKPKDIWLRVCGKLLLTKMLDYYGSVYNACLDAILYSETNKPYFRNGFYFNIAHSEDIVVCAGSEEGEIGVDIEKLKKIDWQLMKEYFNDDEWQVILNSRNQENTLQEFWVKKEAVAKSIGTGIFQEMTNINATISPAIIRNEKIYFEEVIVDSKYVCFVASKQKGSVVLPVFVTSEELLDFN